MSHLNGKVAVVTGASKGIGAGIAKDLAAHGASVVVNYSTSKEGADKVVAEIIGAGGKAIAVGGSVAKPEDIDRIFAETKKAYGRVDILVNNAGVYAFLRLKLSPPRASMRCSALTCLGSCWRPRQRSRYLPKKVEASLTSVL
jgi:3-oxoacyl-[acyl-carrier protein] reductase